MVAKEWLQAEKKWLEYLERRYCATLTEMGIEVVADPKIVISKEIDNELIEVRCSIRAGIEDLERQLAILEDERLLIVHWDKFNKVWSVEKILNGKCIGCLSYDPEELDADNKNSLIDVTSEYLAWIADKGLLNEGEKS